MEKATPSRTHDAPNLEALAAAIQAAIAQWPAGCVCQFCGAAAPAKAAVLFSPSTGLLFVAPSCLLCAADPAAFQQPLNLTEN